MRFMVASELSLVFWRYLAESRYLTSLWVSAAHASFPFGHSDLRTRQKDMTFRMQQLNYVRTRAAQHEPIHPRDLAKDLQFALELAQGCSRCSTSGTNGSEPAQSSPKTSSDSYASPEIDEVTRAVRTLFVVQGRPNGGAGDGLVRRCSASGPRFAAVLALLPPRQPVLDRPPTTVDV